MNILLFKSNVDKNKHVQHFLFDFEVTRQDSYKKNQDTPCEEFENETKKKDKNFVTFLSRDSNPRFSVIFLPTIWIFMEGEGDEIKSRQGS